MVSSWQQKVATRLSGINLGGFPKFSGRHRRRETMSGTMELFICCGLCSGGSLQQPPLKALY